MRFRIGTNLCGTIYAIKGLGPKDAKESPAYRSILNSKNNTVKKRGSW
jgi:hypothetical protein